MSSWSAKWVDTEKAPQDTANQEPLQVKSNMDRELVNADSSILYRCNFCEMRYSDKRDVELHLQTHFGSKIYECTDCETSFTNVNNLLNHLNNHRVKNFKCSKCSATFHYVRRFVKHIKSHEYEKLYQCQHCEYNSRYPSTHARHLNAHKQERNVKRDNCGNMHSNQYSSVQHLRLDSDKKFTCSRCNKKFQNNRTLKMHFKSRKGCDSYFIVRSNDTKVVCTNTSSLRCLSEEEAISGPENPFGQRTSFTSEPEFRYSYNSDQSVGTLPTECNSVERALSRLGSQSLAAKCSDAPDVLAYSRPETECVAKNLILKRNSHDSLSECGALSNKKYASGDTIFTRLRTVKESCELYGSPMVSGSHTRWDSSNNLSIADISTCSVPRSQKKEGIYQEQAMQSVPVSASENMKECLLMCISEPATLTARQTLIGTGEHNHNGQVVKNVPRSYLTLDTRSSSGPDEYPEVHSNPLTKSGREFDFVTGPTGDSLTFFGSNTFEGIPSLTEYLLFSDILNDSALGPQYAPSNFEELSTSELSSTTWAHSAPELHMETSLVAKEIFPQAPSSRAE